MKKTKEVQFLRRKSINGTLCVKDKVKTFYADYADKLIDAGIAKEVKPSIKKGEKK